MKNNNLKNLKNLKKKKKLIPSQEIILKNILFLLMMMKLRFLKVKQNKVITIILTLKQFQGWKLSITRLKKQLKKI